MGSSKGTDLKRAAFEKSFTDEFGFIFTFGKPVNEQPNRMGRRYNCALQLVGPVDNLSSAGFILPISTQDETTIHRARAYLKTFFSLIPGGEYGSAWVEQNVGEAVISKDGIKATAGNLIVSLQGGLWDDGVTLVVSVSKA